MTQPVYSGGTISVEAYEEKKFQAEAGVLLEEFGVPEELRSSCMGYRLNRHLGTFDAHGLDWDFEYTRGHVVLSQWNQWFAGNPLYE